MRALLRLPSVMTSKIREVQFVPNHTSNVRAQLYRNMKGVLFRVYQGNERVNIKIEGCQDKLTHNWFIITSIVCNRTAKDTLRMAIASIGVYCEILFKENHEANLKRMQDAVYTLLLTQPWIVVRCEQ